MAVGRSCLPAKRGEAAVVTGSIYLEGGIVWVGGWGGGAGLA